MALSINELELESSEYLPNREVMSAWGGTQGGDEGHTVDGGDGNEYQGGILNGVNIQDVLTDIDVEEIQVGLVNVMVEDVNSLLDVGTYNDDEIANVED